MRLPDGRRLYTARHAEFGQNDYWEDATHCIGQKFFYGFFKRFKANIIRYFPTQAISLSCKDKYQGWFTYFLPS